MFQHIRWRLALPFILLLLLLIGGLGGFLISTIRQQEIRIVVTLVAAGLSILLAAILAEYISRPIRKLNEAVKLEAFGDLQLEPFPANDDEVLQLASSFNTVVRQLRSQISEVEAEQKKLETVLDRLTDGIVIVGEEGDVQLINPAAKRMFGVQPTSQPGQSLAKITRHHQIVDLWRLTRDSESTRAITVELLTKRLTLQAYGIHLTEYLPGSTLLVFQDVTHVRHLETVRRDFISNISHELRTPLASLKALTETLQDGALEDPQVSRHFLTRIETEVDSMALMVQELLELSRIESGKFPLHMETISPHKLISSAVDRLRLQAERNGLSLQVDLPSDSLPDVLADPVRLEQVIVNLIHNAIKFTPSGGEIIASAWHEGESVIFSIKDTGIGISEFDLPRIFERFFKADRARSGGGTGLGLAISKHMVEAHSGKIWAESLEGKGSTFFFSIPQAK